jgi:outer membrane protein OmpA-like peptidoglycan-associated protein
MVSFLLAEGGAFRGIRPREPVLHGTTRKHFRKTAMLRFAPAIILAFLSTNLPALAGDGQSGSFVGNWPSQEQMNRIRNWNPHVGEIQRPGEIQAPGAIQAPKQIEAPKEVETVKATTSECETHLAVLADTLFDFDKADLRKDAETTLEAASPQIRRVTEEGKHPARVEGHTDGKGSDAYNLRLSKARARSVRDWLVSHEVLPSGTEIVGFGKSMPVAPNAFDDGSDNPEGRQKNRRVEITVETCKG